MPRRNAQRVPHHRLSRDERFVEALAALTHRLDRLRAAINREHPVQGCLPLPALELPTGPDALGQLCKNVCDNLFTEQGHRAQRWIDARTHCVHLTEDQVIDVNEMVYKWYQLLTAALHHIDDQPLKDLDWSKEIFDRWIPASTHRDDVGDGSENGGREPATDHAGGDEVDQ